MGGWARASSVRYTQCLEQSDGRMVVLAIAHPTLYLLPCTGGAWASQLCLSWLLDPLIGWEI